jgi:thiamine pyrophosphokinase
LLSTREPDPDNAGGGIAPHTEITPSTGLVEGFLRAVIFANGGFTRPPEFLPDDMIIAADGGARHCIRLGIKPDLVVGDFDSIEKDELDQLLALGCKLIRYPTHKDFTDLELALQHAHQHGATEVLVLAALGRRWDQTLANVLLPAGQAYTGLKVRLLDGPQEILLVHPRQTLELHGEPGDTLSLIPLMGDATGITTGNLEYPLQGETLHFGSTRGVSNVMQAKTATVYLETGLLLCVVIHQLDLPF